MRKLGLLPLATSLIGVAVAATSSPAHAEQHDVTLGGVRVALHDHTRQVVTVDHTHGYHARIQLRVLGPPLCQLCIKCGHHACGTEVHPAIHIRELLARAAAGPSAGKSGSGSVR